MFRLFRSRKQVFRILLGVMVTPIIITMVVTLIPGIFGGSSATTGGETVLAQVGGEQVTSLDAQAQLQDMVRSQRMPAGAQSFLAPQVVQNLVTDKALLQEANRLGLGVTEQELAEYLRNNLPMLFPGGAFVGKDQYAAYVMDRFSKTIPEFEELVRNDLAITKLRHLVTDGVVVTPAEIEQEYRRRKERVRIEYVSVSPAAVKSSVSATPAELEEYFKKNKTAYFLPERRSFQYMVISDARVAAGIQVTPQEMERYYNENKDRFRVQDRVHATHILLKTTDKSADEVKKIEAKAQELLRQARAGKDFAELAKANSEDTASASKGGDIGWITHGQTVPEFEQKAFAMKPGEISDVIKTQYGFHIIKVLEREEARLKPFEEVAPAIRKELIADRSDLERARLADSARAAASRNPQNLPQVGRDLGLPVYTAALLERGKPIPEIGAEPALTDALFSAVKGSVVGPIQMAGMSVVAVVTEVAPPRQAEFAEVADRVKNDYVTAKSREAAEARAKQVLEKAKAAGGDLRKAAKAFGLEVKSTDPFTRDGSIPGLGTAATVAQAFTAPVHSINGPVTAGGDYVVYQVTERIEPDMAGLAGEASSIRESILGSRRNQLFEVFKSDLRESLKKQGKIRVFQDRIDRFVAANRG
jgi:peptidyl-prolyl cis-trans isomerase D